MVVGKVSEFIGSLYSLCVTLLRFKNIMKLKNYLLLLALLLAVGVRAQVPSGNKYPKREFRGAWIQAVNSQFRGIPTERLKQILISQLNSLQGAGINAIIFQVRPEADALYASQYEPWSRFLTGTQGQTPSPMWDPMQFMIEECQKRNMEFHAWINPYRVKTSLKNELAPEHIYHQHPEWFITYGDQLYFDPALPESREYICKIVTDIVSRYDVDAIHMDDYFYPYLRGTGISSCEDVSVERHADKESYAGVCDDIKVGVSLIFYLQNMVPYVKAQYESTLPIRGTTLTLSGLSLKGSILLPISKNEKQKQKVQKASMNRNQLIDAARKGDEDAIETLTLEDMDTYTSISKKILTEDVFSLVDTYFMPYGVECDQYSIMGEILDISLRTNRITQEEIYVMRLSCNDLQFDVCINKQDLYGEPQAGRRFKGVVWMQGYINYPSV